MDVATPLSVRNSQASEGLRTGRAWSVTGRPPAFEDRLVNESHRFQISLLMNTNNDRFATVLGQPLWEQARRAQL